MILIIVSLILSAVYCVGTWLFLAVQSYRTGANYEVETFHLGLCFVIAVGFLGLILRAGGA